MSDVVDILIVGSGPSGVQAAKRALDDGLSVTMIDFGNNEPELAESIPPLPFSTLRRSDPNQARYFVGETFHSEVDRNDRLGAHFTAPRAYITKDVREFLPIDSETFFPTQSLAMGGLGVGWGAGCQRYEDFELERAGLPAVEMKEHYDDVVADIGVSGAVTDDTADQVLAPRFLQPPSEIDTNARSLLASYQRKRAELRSMGLNLGRDPLAMLTQPLQRPGIDRKPNPYTDMDYYGTADYSIYRPQYTLRELRQRPKFDYLSGVIAERFDETNDGVTVTFSDRSGTTGTRAGRKLLLAAGALNSARIALRARNMFDERLPLLSNAMHYLPCVNLAMLGRPADDRRHSMGQLLGVYTPPHRAPEHLIIGTISYRSLLHYRIVRQMPLPPSLALLLSRTLMTSLTMIGVHHPEIASPNKWIALRRTSGGDTLAADYRASASEAAMIAKDLRALTRCLWKLGCPPLARFSTAPGSSIHYAGTIPFAPSTPSPLESDARGKLLGSKHVFFADSSSWRYLPAKGLTFTLMANARRIARNAAAELGG